MSTESDAINTIQPPEQLGHKRLVAQLRRKLERTPSADADHATLAAAIISLESLHSKLQVAQARYVSLLDAVRGQGHHDSVAPRPTGGVE